MNGRRSIATVLFLAALAAVLGALWPEAPWVKAIRRFGQF